MHVCPSALGHFPHLNAHSYSCFSPSWEYKGDNRFEISNCFPFSWCPVYFMPRCSRGPNRLYGFVGLRQIGHFSYLEMSVKSLETMDCNFQVKLLCVTNTIVFQINQRKLVTSQKMTWDGTIFNVRKRWDGFWFPRKKAIFSKSEHFISFNKSMHFQSCKKILFWNNRSGKKLPSFLLSWVS